MDDNEVVYEALGESRNQIGVIPSESRDEFSSEQFSDIECEVGEKGKSESKENVQSIKIKDLETKAQEFHQRNKTLKTELDATMDQCYNLLVEKDQLEKDYERRLKGLQDKVIQLEKNAEDASTAYAASENRRKKVEERLIEVKRDCNKLEQEKNTLEKEIESWKYKTEAHLKEIASKDEEVKVLKENSGAYLDEWIDTEKTDLENQIKALEKNLQNVKESKNQLQTELESQTLSKSSTSMNSQTVAEMFTSDPPDWPKQCEECVTRLSLSCVSLQEELIATSFASASVQTEVLFCQRETETQVNMEHMQKTETESASIQTEDYFCMCKTETRVDKETHSVSVQADCHISNLEHSQASNTLIESFCRPGRLKLQLLTFGLLLLLLIPIVLFINRESLMVFSELIPAIASKCGHLQHTFRPII